MCKKAGTPVVEFPLPPGFRFAMYRDGDELEWARIETSVDEFDSEFAALLHFTEKFIPFADELCRRLVFIETDDGRKVATANAWWSIINHKRNSWLPWRCEGPQNGNLHDRRAWLHWVAVDAGFQGLGLGKAVVSRALQVLREIEGDVDVFLSTQTWSYRAIDIYKKHGFEPTDEKILYFGREKNDYKRAMKILAGLDKR